jgi:hypothetical protein
VNKKITIQEFDEMRQTLFGNVVIHPSVPDDLIPCARFVWDADVKEMVFDGFANFDRGRRDAEK